MPLFHILGLVVCFLPCAMTDAVLLVPDDIRTNTLIRVMNSEHCTLLHSVPTMIIALLNNEDFSAEAFSCLRRTYLAGAAATEAQLRMFREELPDDHFMIAYGLSEMAPVSVTLYEDPGDSCRHRPASGGRLRMVLRRHAGNRNPGEGGRGRTGCAGHGLLRQMGPAETGAPGLKRIPRRLQGKNKKTSHFCRLRRQTPWVCRFSRSEK